MSDGVEELPKWVTEVESEPAFTGKDAHGKLAVWRQRQFMMQALGNKCDDCGTDEWLEFDHWNGRNWSMRAKSQWARTRILMEEFQKGLLRLLCRSCNARDGNRRKWGKK